MVSNGVTLRKFEETKAEARMEGEIYSFPLRIQSKHKSVVWALTRLAGYHLPSVREALGSIPSIA